MVKCLVCESMHQELSCPVCHMARPGFLTVPDQAALKAMKKRVFLYRKKLLKDVKVSVPVYRFQKMIVQRNGKYVFEKPERFTCNLYLSKLAGKEIDWYPEEFSYLEGNLELECTYSAPGIDAQTLKITIPDPQAAGQPVKLGIMRLPGLKFALLYGTKEKYTQSEPMPILTSLE